eukprot:1243768-Rhodomonas_salina.3
MRQTASDDGQGLMGESGLTTGSTTSQIDPHWHHEHCNNCSRPQHGQNAPEDTQGTRGSGQHLRWNRVCGRSGRLTPSLGQASPSPLRQGSPHTDLRTASQRWARRCWLGTVYMRSSRPSPSSAREHMASTQCSCQRHTPLHAHTSSTALSPLRLSARLDKRRAPASRPGPPSISHPAASARPGWSHHTTVRLGMAGTGSGSDRRCMCWSGIDCTPVRRDQTTLRCCSSARVRLDSSSASGGWRLDRAATARRLRGRRGMSG